MFEPGKIYRRDQLHKVWDGDRKAQSQGGILTPKGQPFIILITGAHGHRYGYDDEWKDEVFHYFGAGQEGPMVWKRGNAAIRDSGKDLHLFEEVPNGLQYRQQLDYAGYKYRHGARDKKGNLRRAIVFLLTPHDEVAPKVGSAPPGQGRRDPRWSMDLGKLKRRARANRRPAKTTKDAPRAVYERSKDLRIYILRRADGVCEGCDTAGPFRTKSRPQRPYLEPHHTERLSDGGPDHPSHVIALCPNCHRRVHHGEDGAEYNRQLKRRLRLIEPK